MPYTTIYSLAMFVVVESATFKAWFKGLRDVTAQSRIAVRLRRVSIGNLGDAKPVGGGDKRTQAADIKRVQKMAAELKD